MFLTKNMAKSNKTLKQFDIIQLIHVIRTNYAMHILISFKSQWHNSHWLFRFPRIKYYI